MSQQDLTVGEHTEEMVSIHASILEGTGVTSRYVEALPGERVHLLEFGQGDPLVMLHGSGPTSLQLLPLITELPNRHVMAVDRPGFGLSDPHQWPEDRRGAAIEWIDVVLDALGLDNVSLLGSSYGGTWAIWYALSHPQRIDQLILIGAPPGLNVNKAPEPLRMIAAIDPTNPPPMPPPSRETVIQSMTAMGEGETITRYPEQVDAMVAASRDPVSGRASLDELQSLITAVGWSSNSQTDISELQALTCPTLLVLGDHDPLGDLAAAEQTAESMPASELVTLDAGHGPWLGHPATIARLITQSARLDS